MRTSKYLLATLKKAPKDCEIISHQLMLRAGLIRQVSSGLYTWLPTGLRVLQKIKNIIREEMNKINFVEISMPIVQPALLWKQSGRWLEYGSELLKLKNRNNQEFVLGPTHEEMITDLICKEALSNNHFPIKIYQIHTKYRDEIRPRFGILRSREFTMKDGYSFHMNHKSLQKTYDTIYQTYHTIFNRIKLNFCVVQANSGKIGGKISHEFQAYSNNGEDKIAIPTYTTYKPNHIHKICDSINNIKIQPNSPTETIKSIKLPNIHSISELLIKFNLSINKIVKIVPVRTNNKYKNNLYNFLGLVIRGDHQLNHQKISTIPEISFPLSIVNDIEIQQITGKKTNIINFIKLSIPLIIDYNAAIMSDFIIESDVDGKYLFGVNWYRDLPITKIADLYQPINNYKINKTQDKLSIQNSVEIGHIFQLGSKYSKLMHHCIQRNNNRNLSITMGCYGIGITRIIAVIIEQNYDKNGIIWPDAIAPFKLAIIPINMYNSINVQNTVEKLYTQLLPIIGSDIIIDDRKKHPGIMFTDMDLIGIPHILIISDDNLNNQEIEYKSRKTGIIKKIKLEIIIQFLSKKLIDS